MPLSIYDTLTFLPNLSLVLTKSTFTLLTSPFRGPEQQKKLSDYLTTRATCVALYTFSVGQLQYVF
jgi:hypothetical protein